jgi:SET domain-containing protein
MAASKLYRIRRSSIHNRGLYAAHAISKGTYIVQYFGEKITKAESYRRSVAQQRRGQKNGSGMVYIFELNQRYDLDGYRRNNPARYINHSCDPNCEAVNDRGNIWVVALRDIEPGEELTYEYGYDVEHFLDHPCRCGADNCVGYIVRRDQWTRLRQLLRKRKAQGGQTS